MIKKPCMRKVWFMDVQWSDCPQSVHDEVRRLWSDNELGNDHYMFIWSNEDSEEYPLISKYINENIPEEEKNMTVIIYWWW